MKSQSAMEYLMTYGWAVLIIAIVLAALFDLGVFGGLLGGTPISAISSPGFSITNPIMNNQGALNFKLEYLGTGPITITGVDCSSGTVLNESTMSYTGMQSDILISGQSDNITVDCPLTNHNIGTTFAGSIWIRYQNQSYSAYNQTEQIAVIKGSPQHVYNLNTIPINVVYVGTSPDGIAYDPSNGYMYIVNQVSNTVNVISGTTPIASISVGIDPLDIAYDPSNGYIYVVDGSGTVSVISGTPPIASIPPISVGGEPYGIAYNPSNGYMYVTVQSSGTVNVISGTTPIASIPVGIDPYEIAYNPSNGYMYVTVQSSGTVNVISGTTPIASIPVGTYPFGIAYDPSNGYMYVANNNYFGTVNVISGTTPIASIPVGIDPVGSAYDPSNG